MNRLLNRTLFYYTLSAALILMLSAPFFYFVMEKLYNEDVDEAIYLRKKEFEINNLHKISTSDIDKWNEFNRDIRIIKKREISQPKDQIVGELIYDEFSPEWEPYRVLYTDIKINHEPYILKIQLNLVESEDLIKAIIFSYLLILCGMILILFFTARSISNRLWAPFYKTLGIIERFNLENEIIPVFSETKIKEFTQLNIGIEKMISSSLQSYNTQKVFTQNASHELQTPLAIFQSKLDLLLQDVSLTEEQSIVLQSLYEAILRLSRINKNLLLLAKIENKQYSEITNFSVNDLIMDVSAYFEEQAESKNIIIEIKADDTITLNANRVLTEIMINNLILNAIRHNKENGKVIISIENGLLIISNTGNSEKLDSANLFKRFGKSTAETKGSGLGLAIVKEIADRYLWSIGYYHKENVHFFSAKF